MPDFLEEFALSLADKKESMKEKVFKGKPNPLHESFKKQFEKSWVPLGDVSKLAVSPQELDVMAVDSSVYTNLLSTGGIFYITRSLAVCRNYQQKELETDVFFTKAGLFEAHAFVGAKMEMLEFTAAINAVKNGHKCSVILIDGSLYGRVVHLPIETKIEEDRLALLSYFEVYKELLELCRKENILLIGVSKESRSTFYRDYLLGLIFKQDLSELQIDAEDLKGLKSLFSEILERKTLDYAKLDRMRRKYGSKLEKIGIELKELSSSRPDYQLIMSLAETIGYTQPMLLGLSASTLNRLGQYQSNPKRYVEKIFPNSVAEEGEKFIHRAVDTVLSIASFPGFVSFYVLLDRRDSPMRVDLPWWNCTLPEARSTKPVNPCLEGLLKVMATGYGGLDCYNLWLKNVDEKVRLKKRIVDSIYFPYMERQFEEKIIRGRGYRRVRYP